MQMRIGLRFRQLRCVNGAHYAVIVFLCGAANDGAYLITVIQELVRSSRST
jgi:hypothetical protein